MLNRSAIVLTKKRPFLDWVRSLPDPMSSDTTLAQLDQDRGVYLMPEWEMREDRDEMLADSFDLLFRRELVGWHRLESDWPQKRTLKMFKKWFDVEFHSVIDDLVGGPLVDEDYED